MTIWRPRHAVDRRRYALPEFAKACRWRHPTGGWSYRLKPRQGVDHLATTPRYKPYRYVPLQGATHTLRCVRPISEWFYHRKARQGMRHLATTRCGLSNRMPAQDVAQGEAGHGRAANFGEGRDFWLFLFKQCSIWRRFGLGNM